MTKNLKKLGCEVHVTCNEEGHGRSGGLSPMNAHNSDVLLKILYIVHVQYEQRGLKLDSINPRKISTNIDLFYEECNNGNKKSQW